MLTAAAICATFTGCSQNGDNSVPEESQSTSKPEDANSKSEKPADSEISAPAPSENGAQKCLDIEKMLIGYFAGGELDKDMLSDVTELRIFGNKSVSVVCGSDRGTDLGDFFDNQEPLVYPEFSSYSGDTELVELLDLYYGDQVLQHNVNNEYNLEDISFVEYFPQLERLEIPASRITDISPLKNCTHLQYLNLSCAVHLEDISPLKDCTELQTLRLAGSPVEDISVLSELSDLQVLNLSETKVTDLSPLTKLNDLTVLLINKTQPMNIKQLADISSLKILAACETGLSDLSDLNGLDNLESLWASDNPMTSLSFFEIKLPKLSTLWVSDVDWNGVLKDISTISSLTSLKKLNLTGNKIKDISAICSLTSLEELNLTSNQINDISGIEKLVNLKELNIRGNQIEDITPLSSLTNLKNLLLYKNNITDYSPLYGLTNLESITVGLHNNSISEENLAALKEALPNCEFE